MQGRFTSLSFIIGLFFILVALTLVCGYFINAPMAVAINLYAGIAFLLFGLLMIWIRGENKEA